MPPCRGRICPARSFPTSTCFSYTTGPGIPGPYTVLTMNYLLWISYKGTRYAGFQVQPNAPTVCAVLQDAMQAVLGQRPDVKGCSRTDSGVHARRFALSFCYTGKVPMAKLVPALNAHLPPDIRAVDIQPVPDDFHARYAAHAKTYHYYILNARVDDPFTFDTCYRVGPPLDVAAMQAAAKQFVGTHDFSALCASGSSAAAHGDTVRTITDCTVIQSGNQIVISVTADGYLYNMVRILAGTLVDAGLHKRTPESILPLLESRDRRQAGPTLPAKGLFLEKVEYPRLNAVL